MRDFLTLRLCVTFHLRSLLCSVMACTKYVEAVFGAGLVSDSVMEYLRKDLVGDLASLLVSVHAAYAGRSYERMMKSLRAMKVIRNRLPESLDKFDLDTNYPLIMHIMLAMSVMGETSFVEKFTRSDMAFLEQLKVKRIMRLFLEVEGQV